MKAIESWNFTPYRPYNSPSGGLEIVRIQPEENEVVFEWLGAESAELHVCERNGGKEHVASVGAGTARFGAEAGKEYEFFVERDGRRSKTRLVRAGGFPGTVVDYLHPEDDAYAHSGKYLATPCAVRTPDGALLFSEDVFALGHPQNLTRLFRSEDDGKSWHFVTELFPCIWATLFVIENFVYALAASKEYGDLLIGRSDDNGYTWTAPAVIARGSSFGSRAGFHKSSVPLAEADGRYWCGVEYGCWSEKAFAPLLASFPAASDPMKVGNWTLTDYASAESLGFSQSPCAIEGNALVMPDGKVCDLLRQKENEALLLESAGAESPLSFRAAVKFPFAHTKFHVQKYGGYYYAVGNEAPGRTALSLARSEDGIRWKIVRRILDYSVYSPEDVGFQYPHFFLEGDTMYLSVRAGFNGSKNYHDSNAVIFLKTKL